MLKYKDNLFRRRFRAKHEIPKRDIRKGLHVNRPGDIGTERIIKVIASVISKASLKNNQKHNTHREIIQYNVIKHF